MWLTRFAITRPIIVAMLFIGLAVFGAISYNSLGRALNPNVTFPIVLVEASYPGASPSEMERLVIKPIEDQIDGIDNLDKMSATAQEGRAVVIVQFKLDTNIDYAAIDVQRRVDTARVFMPTDLDPPLVDKSAGSQQAPILSLVLTSKSLAPTALSDLVHDRIVPDIRHIPNVQSVDVGGEYQREFHVNPDPNRLIGTGATLTDVFGALAQNNANLPGGRLDSPTNETDVSVHSEIQKASDMAGIPLMVTSFTQPLSRPSGLRVGDVADVSDNHLERRIISKYKGQQILALDVYRVITADEIKSTEVARDKLKTIEAKYPSVVFTETDAPAEYTQASLNGVLQSLLEGILLTAIVLMLFLHAWRNAVVVMIAIPSSLLATFVMMRVFGFTLDIVSLMGLSLTIGILVDDSIVVLENITRHRDMGEPPMDAAINGRSEIGGAAVAITLVDVVVFLPIAFLSGIVGKFMKEFGIVVVVATLFSLFVSFTLTPMLAARWSVRRRSQAPPRYLAWFQNGFDALTAWYRDQSLPFALRHRWLIGGMCALLVLNGLALVGAAVPVAIFDLIVAGLLIAWLAVRRLFASSTRLPAAHARVSFAAAAICGVLALGLLAISALGRTVSSEFVPDSQTGDIAMTLTYPVGTPLYKTQIAVDRLEQHMLAIDGVASTFTRTGSKPAGWGSTVGGNVARLHATMDKKRRGETNRAIGEMRKLGYLAPGAVFTVAGDSGNGDPIYYTMSGPESEIQGAADKLAKFIKSIPGTVNVQTGAEGEGDRLNINIDRARCAMLGVNPGDAATAARIAIGGAVATKVRTETGLVDVRVQLPAAWRNRLADVQSVRVRAIDGSMYRLSDVAHFEMGRAPTKIERLDKQRVVRVTGGVDAAMGTRLGDVSSKIDQWIHTPGNLPSGVGLTPQGDSQFFAETMSSMGLALVTSFALVYMLMVILYGSFLTPFVIMFSVPVAIVGALAGLCIANQTLNLFSMIGIIMLFGLVAKNGILLVDYANTMRHRGLRAVEAMRAAAGIRLRPILMTTVAMVFGMLPLALGLAEGAEFRRSMGTVLIGGLISSLILTLFLVPVVYCAILGIVQRWEDRRAVKEEAMQPEYEGEPLHA
jgi:hydrophobic/amphiphilic exporter-1 (mainly G- bacteria), HAE1 family